MIVVIAKHGYIDKQYCYFVIVSLELYRQKCISFRQRFMPEGAHLIGGRNKHDLPFIIYIYKYSFCISYKYA